MRCPERGKDKAWDCDTVYQGRRPWGKLWRPMNYLYCPRHGNYLLVDGRWWWFSYFRPGLLLKKERVAFCPRKCWGRHWEFKEVHEGKDGRYHCGHCLWDGDAAPKEVPA